MNKNKIDTPLWLHQSRAVALSYELDGLGVFFEIGTGKSRTAIEMMRHRFQQEGRIMRTLILAPKIVLTNWKRELLEFSMTHDWDIVVLYGPSADRLSDFEELVKGKNKIVITNYETLQMQNIFSHLTDWCPEIIIADEAHRLRNPDSVRAKQCMRLAEKAKFRYALTGTPILNSAMDVFNIFKFIDNGDTFGTNFYRFRSIWFEDANAQWAGRQGHFPKWVPRKNTYQELNELISKKSIQAKKSECLDLPPFIRQNAYVEMGVEQRKTYAAMKKDFIAYLDDPEVTAQPRAVIAQMAMTKALRLQQIVTGYAKADDGSIVTFADNPRIDALEELLLDLTPSHKVIVWSVFIENYSIIKKRCDDIGIMAVEVHGGTSDKQRDININKFKTDNKCRVLIGNQSALGIGINLIEANVCIYYSKNFSLEHDLQSEGRCYRGGSERHISVTRIDLVCPGTIDEIINQALEGKQNIANLVLGWKDKL